MTFCGLPPVPYFFKNYYSCVVLPNKRLLFICGVCWFDFFLFEQDNMRVQVWSRVFRGDPLLHKFKADL